MRLGLMLDPANENLNSKLLSIRNQDPVLPDCRSMDGTLDPVRNQQLNEIHEWAETIGEKPEFVKACFFGLIETIKKTWTTDMLSYRYTDMIMLIKSPT